MPTSKPWLEFDPAAPGTKHETLIVPTGIELMVCQDIAARQQFGKEKYGTTLADNPLPLREWLHHAYLESLDHALYLRRAIAEIDAKTASDKTLPGN